MARVKGGFTTRRRHKKVLKLAKGYFGSKHRLFKTANEQVMKSLLYAYRDRRQKKRDFRKLWIARINAAARMNGLSYSKFMHGLKLADVNINRKMLADLAVNDINAFNSLAAVAKEKKKFSKKDKIKEAEIKIKELEDKLLREKAELINYRRRKDEEVSRMLKYCNEDLILELLPLIDNFESAIKMDDTNLEDEVSKFLQGFKMIYANLLSTFEKFDIRPIDGVNKPFDPTYHQAVMTEKCDKESGIVIDVLRKGYLLKDKVIRPAMVKVSE